MGKGWVAGVEGGEQLTYGGAQVKSSCQRWWGSLWRPSVEGRLTCIDGGPVWGHVEGPVMEKAVGLWLLMAERQLLVCPQTCDCRVGLVARESGYLQGGERQVWGSVGAAQVWIIHQQHEEAAGGCEGKTWACRVRKVLCRPDPAILGVFLLARDSHPGLSRDCRDLWSPWAVNFALCPCGHQWHCQGESLSLPRATAKLWEVRRGWKNLFCSAWRREDFGET